MLNRRGFFGWLVGAVGGLVGVKAEANFPLPCDLEEEFGGGVWYVRERRPDKLIVGGVCRARPRSSLDLVYMEQKLGMLFYGDVPERFADRAIRKHLESQVCEVQMPDSNTYFFPLYEKSIEYASHTDHAGQVWTRVIIHVAGLGRRIWSQDELDSFREQAA